METLRNTKTLLFILATGCAILPIACKKDKTSKPVTGAYLLAGNYVMTGGRDSIFSAGLGLVGINTLPDFLLPITAINDSTVLVNNMTCKATANYASYWGLLTIIRVHDTLNYTYMPEEPGNGVREVKTYYALIH
jgi:hypothetical protein